MNEQKESGYCPNCNEYENCTSEYKEDAGCCDAYKSNRRREMQWFEKCKCGEFVNTCGHNCIYTNKDMMIKHLEQQNKELREDRDNLMALISECIELDYFKDEAILILSDLIVKHSTK